MKSKHEPHIQAVVRRVMVASLSQLGNALSEEGKLLAARLEACDPETILELRKHIDAAERAWSDEARVVAMRHEGVFWRLTPKVLEDDKNGTRVELRWGWDDEYSVTTSGRDALDLARELLGSFMDEYGKLREPREPAYDDPGRPNLRFFDDFMENAGELMKVEGWEDGASLLETMTWVALDKPVPVPVHTFVDYPEDEVRVCSACGEWYRTTLGIQDQRTRVCLGEPNRSEEYQTIHIFDPRRSPTLREAQRLDRIVWVLDQVKATRAESAPFASALKEAIASLVPEDRKRFDDARAGR